MSIEFRYKWVYMIDNIIINVFKITLFLFFINKKTMQNEDSWSTLLQCYCGNFFLTSIFIYMCMYTYPVNTKQLYNICTTSAQRLRRWSNIVQMLYKCLVFTGYMYGVK